ncbi:MAG: hypothetical protein EOO73_15190 [Myxococcales bacterium]|nr:MAG: hypothetical protein EOO73_15190 [Myxococcales bacterium]
MAPGDPAAPSLDPARSLAGGIGAVAALGASMAWLWGFTVDDALITARVASHLASGAGYRFNAGGPVVDAVTPLGFAVLLAPFGGQGPLGALAAAKWLGAGAVLVAVFGLGRRLFSRTSAAYAAALLLCLAVTAPLAAWSVAGMETGLVTALGIASLGEGALADVAAALAAGLRPELAPWCASVRLGLRLASGVTLKRAALSPALVLGAVALVAALRAVLFGRAAPLSVFAKPSDLEHGVRYAVFAFVQTGLPLLCVAPFSLRRGAPIARAVALAGVVHFAALAAVGGDWMSLYRLAVPVLPSFVLGAAELSRVAPPWASWLRAALAGALSLHLWLALSGAARGVGPDRERLIESAKAPLAGARSVAALDVGWVGAVADFKVIDLAGVTDPRVALLPGGHTSKRIDDALLRSRDVDALVLLAPPHDREVERRVRLLPSAESFRVVAELPLAGGQRYVVLRKP